MGELQTAARGSGRSMRAHWFVVAIVATLVSGCATGKDNAAAVSHGEALAEQACSSCHGMGLMGASNVSGAPPFRDMRLDYNAISYERSMAAWHLGHVTMPPAEISMEDLRDIGAYVRSLKHR